MAAVQSSGENWSSRAAFIMAAVGSAVGLGNLWRFPFTAGENGGGAFVLLYVLCVVLIGLPVLAAELYLGRRGQGSAVAAITRLAKSEGKSGAWSFFAWIGMIASFLIVTFYSVIAGWVVYFAFQFLMEIVANIGTDGIAGIAGGAYAGESSDAVAGKLGGLLESPHTMIGFHALFMLMTGFIVSRGISGGIEAAVKFLMPMFFVMLLILTGFSMVQGDAGAAVSYLFKPDMGALVSGFSDGSILLAALGQAFFSIGLGSVLMVTYGMYMNKQTDIPGSTRIVGIADTLVALIAGLAIFPLVFQFGLEPSGGPGLMFVTLPLAFQQMPFGALFGFAFFSMAFFAALTSAISLLEVASAWADGDIDKSEEERKKARVTGTIILSVICFAIGCLHALSQVPAGSEHANFFSTWIPVDFMPLFEGKTLLDFTDKLTGDVLLPFGALMTSIFAAWVMSKAAAREELGFKSEGWFTRWLFLTRWVAPIAIAAVLIYGMFIAPTM